MFNALKITKLLDSRKLPVKDFLKESGISKQTYYNLIGAKNGNISTIEKIANCLNVPISYFFDEQSVSITQNGNINAIGENEITVADCESKLEVANARIRELENIAEELRADKFFFKELLKNKELKK
jgi:transcriptional regulator with XRE-family HTH domain